MVLPFLTLVPALGFRYGLRAVGGDTIRKVSVLVFAVAFVFTAVASGTIHPEFADLVGIDKEPREYISDEELSAAEFDLEHMNDGKRAYGRNDSLGLPPSVPVGPRPVTLDGAVRPDMGKQRRPSTPC